MRLGTPLVIQRVSTSRCDFIASNSQTLRPKLRGGRFDIISLGCRARLIVDLTRSPSASSSRNAPARAITSATWGASCGAWGCRGSRRGRATRGKTRPPQRPLKRAPRQLKKLADTLDIKGKRLSVWFQDEARVGQKGRVCHIWWRKGERPQGLCDQRFTFAYIFAAARIGTDDAFCHVVPEANTDAMQQFLDGFAKQLPKNEVAAMFLDRAGWHCSKQLVVPQNVVLFPLPPYSPELSPIERIWLHLKERFLSHRLHDDYNAILDATCKAWNRLTAEAGRITSLCAFPWIEKLTRAAVKI
jgi:hypothetical protein